MKLNASKTKTMIACWSLTMRLQSLPLTIDGTVLKESDDLVILGVTYDSKMTVEEHLPLVSRASSQTLGILRKSWRVSMICHFMRDAFGVLSCPFLSTVLQCGALLPVHTLTCSQWFPVPIWGCI